MLFAPLLACVVGPSFAGSVAASNVSTSDTTPLDQIIQRNALIESYLGHRPIRGVRKMTEDEGEKFYLDYWQFDDDDNYTTGNNYSFNTSDELSSPARRSESLQTTEEVDFQPQSYPFHASYSGGLGSEGGRGWGAAFSPLLRRDFQCPSGTANCTAIDRPDSCCSTDDTCVLVKDTGSGDVGCCPRGKTCSGTIGACADGYSSCPSSLGGGCCIPGYACVSGGCMRVFTITVTVSSTVMLSTSTQTVAATTKTLSTGDLIPPARPTSVSTATSSSTSKTTDSATVSVCPTGFYACSAYYQGGCCRTGRDCDSTSCPAIPSTTLASDGVTIVIPEATATGTATTTTSSSSSSSSSTGRCASGWFSCADTVGGGCCPTGYRCGTSCTAVSTATETVSKEQPTSGGSQTAKKVGGKTGVSIVAVVVAGLLNMT
ncbi:putative GPI anchored protein [Aspergillus homomorphus CBS 101889]|uniref:GPI anchored protein n=1 Tax=Aspergillus homomorphus (strain CBS 101889) TaxID=1450537 RepID=A0A395HUM0_ASPHC|nr:hypothetical protein BO97DRAFT_478525 [Aspergillus homomorphus CBS 101889]RAL11517.1 hypothetical protein BO97DRAFT_478525 [Aspergillus homomorphus CBS 101889]